MNIALHWLAQRCIMSRWLIRSIQKFWRSVQIITKSLKVHQGLTQGSSWRLMLLDFRLLYLHQIISTDPEMKPTLHGLSFQIYNSNLQISWASLSRARYLVWNLDFSQDAIPSSPWGYHIKTYVVRANLHKPPPVPLPSSFPLLPNLFRLLVMHSRQFRLPDLIATCPLKGDINPHYKEAGAESAAWINSYNVFTDRKKAYFMQGCNELLVAHTYPYAG